MADSPIELALTRWRNNLIDLTRRNPLLALRPLRSAYLEITKPDAGALFNALVLTEKSWTFYLPPEPPPRGKRVSGNGQASVSETVPIVRAATSHAEPSLTEGHSARTPQETAPRATELVTAAADRATLLQTLTNLLRRTRADFRERGLQILHVACGILEWRNADEEAMRSPLLLVPVALQRHSLREPFALKPTADEPWLNPALAARLKVDFDFRLPEAPTEWDEGSFAAYLQAVGAAIAGLPGWQVKPEAVLAPFSFHKGVIYQDLHDHAERIQAHPLVQTLAGLPNLGPRVEPISEDQLDELDPQAVQHILDADASQRQALAAAAQGASFVLIGPPGTGKSQTIANLIADRVAAGKKVLFVSEKVAALEVVEQRLHRAGLGDCLMELHSHKTNKRAVVAELARCLQERQRPTADGAAGDDGDRLRQRQRHLTTYVRALHLRRDPMAKSVWEVLADLPSWRDLPTLPLDVPLERQGGAADSRLVISEMTQAKLDELRQMFLRAQNLWHIRTAADYPWIGFKAERFTLQLRDEIAGLIDKAQQWGEKLLTTANKVAAELDIAAPVGWLLRLGELLEHRPGPTPRAWLFGEDLEVLGQEIEQAGQMYRRLREGRAPLTARYGPGIWKLEVGAADRLEATWRRAAELLAPGDDAGAHLLTQQKRLRGWAADTQKRLPSWHSDLRTLEKWLGLTLPAGFGAVPSVVPGHEGEDPAPQSLKLFLRLAHLCHTENPPERSWLTDAEQRRAAQEQILSSRPDFTKYRQDRKKLLETYTEGFFDLELARIAEGYAGPYQSWFRFLNGQYRRDRRMLVRRSRLHELPATAEEDVVVGRDVQALRVKLEEQSSKRWQTLGKYERGLDTDLDAAEKGVRIATETLELLRPFGLAAAPDKLIEALCSGAPADKIRAALNRLQESFGSWWHETQELAALLPMSQLPGRGALDESALSVIVAFARELQNRLNPLAEATDPLTQAAPQQPTDLAAMLQDLRGAAALLADEAQQVSETQALQARFGALFTGPETDWEAIQRKVVWTRKLREAWMQVSDDGAPTDPTETFVAVAAGEKLAPSFRELRSGHDHFRQALGLLEHRFDAPGPKLADKPWRDVPDEEVLEHLGALRDRIGELTDWIEWRLLPERFGHLGLAKFWQALLQLDPTSAPLVDLFQKAFWSRWLEWVVQKDSALGPFRRDEHERVLAEFRALDRQMLKGAAARVLRRVAEHSGPWSDEQSNLLTREAHKKTKHLPLRRLFDAMPQLLLQLKPCLLMSPLSVSQFLPADPDRLNFDLIVFDEASQIVPEDAIGAIVRGKQIIVTGDNRQLPPTTFFQQTMGETEESEEDPGLFESVLDACLGAGFPQQWLRWHYRSQHENLIAFANDRIYENRLVTFPGAVAQDPELGVQFRHVPEGRYDRGGRRDNPREASVVADLVIDHLRRQPQKTLGVIAFSYAQMEAIENELERRLAEAPELEPYFQDERLEGFFVKNLETVQGDERDVILLSVGYGPDESGKVVMNFGPLNRQGGERRLNVAVTRARQKLIVVSSLHARDIAKATTPGLQFLQQYLDYAENGIAALRPAPAPSSDSPSIHALEADVRQVLTERGFTVVPRVGYASYRVDLAVVDATQPGRFMLGVEFDGPMYDQARTARDRDRLRQEVLAKLGWKLHRIWSLDWMLRRGEEVERLLRALAGG